MDSLEKLKAQTNLAIAEVKALMAYLWLKGGPGSGNWGHAGRPGKRGGSVQRKVGMSLRTGRDAERRQKAAKAGGQFFKGNLKTSSIQQIYDGSSDEVKALADETGIIATDAATLDYVKKSKAHLSAPPGTNKVEAKQVTKAQFDQSVDDYASGYYAKTSMDSFGKQSGSPPYGMYDYYSSNKTIHEGQETALHALRKAANKQNRKSLSQDDFDIVPTDKELKVFQKLAISTTTAGNLGKNVGKKFDKLTQDELDTLTEYGRRAHSLNIAEGAATKAGYQAGGYYAAKPTAKAAMQAISREALKNPVKPGENLGDYAKRLSSGLDKPQPAAKNFNTNQMSAMHTVTGAERKHLEDKIQAGHDTKTHYAFKMKVNNVFAVKDSPENEAKFVAARERSAKRLADAGIKGSAVTHLWHGTSTYGGGRIAATGFKIPPANDPNNAGRMLDAGVYLAHHSSKSALYLGAGVSYSPGRRGMLIQTEAALGIQGQWDKVPNWRQGFKQGKYDTIFAPKGTRNPEWPSHVTKTLYNHEWSVRNTDAVRVRYMIDTETVSPY